MAKREQKEFVLKSRPVGLPTEDNWTLQDGTIPELKDGEVLIESHYISVDPYLRGKLNTDKEGEPTVSGLSGKVVESKNEQFAVGDDVQGYLPWKKFNVSDGKGIHKLAPGNTLSACLGVLGMPGMTAYFGLLRVGEFKEGDVVLVSGAAGAVGSLVVQLAKLRGAKKVIGTAGGSEKCDLVVKEFGADACIDYRKYPTIPEMKQALTEVAPDGIDLFFDNTGGVVSDVAFDIINKYGRVAVCGQIAMYNDTDVPMGPRMLHKTIYKNVTIRGFSVPEYLAHAAEFYKEVAPRVGDGSIKFRETVVDGFEKLPSALIGLFKGANTGKALVRVKTE